MRVRVEVRVRVRVRVGVLHGDEKADARSLNHAIIPTALVCRSTSEKRSRRACTALAPVVTSPPPLYFAYFSKC